MRLVRPSKRSLLVTALVLIGALLWGVAFRPHPVTVETAVVDRGVVEVIVTNSRAGCVRARLRTQVGSLSAGRVEALPFREGAEVDSGAVLVRLEDRAARAQVALARRELDSQEARHEAARAAGALASSEHARAESLAVRGAIN